MGLQIKFSFQTVSGKLIMQCSLGLISVWRTGSQALTQGAWVDGSMRVSAGEPAAMRQGWTGRWDIDRFQPEHCHGHAVDTTGLWGQNLTAPALSTRTSVFSNSSSHPVFLSLTNGSTTFPLWRIFRFFFSFFFLRWSVPEPCTRAKDILR